MALNTMKKILKYTAYAIITPIGLAGLYYAAADLSLYASKEYEEYKFIQSCNIARKRNLKSPSSFIKTKHDYIRNEFHKHDYKKFKTQFSKDQQRSFQLRNYPKSDKIYLHTAHIEYDAKNSFGTAIRGNFICATTQNYNHPYIKRFIPLLMEITGDENRLAYALSLRDFYKHIK